MSFPSELKDSLPIDTLDPTDADADGGQSKTQGKIISPTRTGIHSPAGSVTRRVLMDTDDKRQPHHLMVTGASINGSGLNIKRYSVNQYALPVYGSTDLSAVMATTSSNNFANLGGPYVQPNQGRRSTAPTGWGRKKAGSPIKQMVHRSCEDPIDLVHDPSNVAMAVLQDVDIEQKRRHEIRNLLEINDRKKLSFLARPSRFGLKFKNKSEEERYLKLSGKIIQMHFMNPAEIKNLELSIKRFLVEYQAYFKKDGNRYSHLGRDVDQKYVVRFIEAVRKLYRKEQEYY